MNTKGDNLGRILSYLLAPAVFGFAYSVLVFELKTLYGQVYFNLSIKT